MKDDFEEGVQNEKQKRQVFEIRRLGIIFGKFFEPHRTMAVIPIDKVGSDK